MVSISNSRSYHVNQLGGKAIGLLNLNDCGLTTPQFTIIDFDTISSWNKQLEECQRWLNEHIDKIDDNGILWAVRSSSSIEDSKKQSFAGQFETELNVANKNLASAIFSVAASYSQKNVYGEKATRFGIILQQMIDSDYSGILFSKHPNNYVKQAPVLSIIPGLGNKLVSGEHEGFQAEYSDSQLYFTSKEKTYKGNSVLGGKEIVIEKSSSEIETIIDLYWPKLYNGLKKLEALYNLPLDIEFSIYENTLYWLQVRPMVGRSLDEKIIIWDKTQAEGNYGGITLPLTIAHVQRTYGSVYQKGSQMIGYNAKILAQNRASMNRIVDSINGRMYYNLNAWQGNLYQMPFGKKLVQLLPKIWNMEPVEFSPPPLRHNFIERTKIFFQLLFKLMRTKKYENVFESTFQNALKQYDIENFKKMDIDEQLAVYEFMMNEMGKSAFAAISNGFYTMLAFFRLKRGLRGTKLLNEHPNFINDVLHSEGDVTSIHLLKSYKELVKEITGDKTLIDLFKENNAAYIIEKLPDLNGSIWNKITEYIHLYGDRTSSSELKMETITFKKDPSLFIQMLKESVSLKTHTSNEPLSKAEDYSTIIKSYYAFNFIRIWQLKKRIARLIKRVKARENYRYKRTRIFAIFREMFLAMGDNLVQAGYITTNRDIFHLTVNELLSKEQRENYIAIVENRKADLKENENNDSPQRYAELNGNYYPVPLEIKESMGNMITGIGCCSGVVSGKFIVLDEKTELTQNFSELIVIAKYFEPGWVNIFTQAKGIIAERGNLLSHASIISRELNLPSIVGAKGIMEAIKNTETIKMNGATGVVYLNDE